jgi:hypothetical protein
MIDSGPHGAHDRFNRRKAGAMRRERFNSDDPLAPTRPFHLGAHDGHSHVGQWTRRRFIQTSAGTAALGAVVGTGLLRPGVALAGGPGIGLVEPIPATTEFFPGVLSHVQFPPVLGGDVADPGTVFNFEGAIGAALISGTCEQRNRKTGGKRTLPYMFNDMRFQHGVFRGRDGREREATFAFV